MEVYIRKRRSGAPFEVIAALVAGLAIGFGASYFIFGGDSEPAPPIDSEIAAVPPATTEPTTPPSEEPNGASEAEPSAPPADEPAPAPQEQPAELAKLEDVWPARHLFIAVKGEKLDTNTKEMLAELKPGGVVLRSENIKVKNQLIDLVAEIKAAVGLGTTIDSLPLIAVAQEGGTLNLLNLKEAPAAAKIGEARDLGGAKKAGEDLAESCVERGIGVLLGPVLDIYGENASKEMRARCFGDNHQDVAAIGLAYADGAVGGGVLPVVKHFPGMGTLKGDTQKSLATLTDDQDRMAQIIFPFAEAARCNVPGILVGHVVAPTVDNETKPVAAASLSPKFIKGLLRDKFTYPGVILADDVNKGAVSSKSFPAEKATVAALAAGNDAVLMLNPDIEKIKFVCATIEIAATEGALDRAALSESKKRLDAWQSALKTPHAGLDGPLPQLAPTEAAVADAGEPAAEPAPAGAEIEYTVVGGDSLSKVANKFTVTADQIREWNNLKSDNLFVGQKLKITTASPDAAPATPAAPSEQPPAPPTEPAPAEPAPADAAAIQPPSEEPSVQPPANSKAIEHVVKGGEFLSSIATKYKVTYQDIMTWNHMNDTKLSEGQKLTIYVPADAATPSDANAPAPAEAAPAPTADASPAPAEQAAAPDTEITYSVKKGDNLANIASKYGVTADDIRGWNGIEGNRIDVDQQLKIRPKKIPAE
ncbi:MAG: LysM peptidoglycan-binding domain-containing protein [Candidatus Hydrogenedentes bacterium]|nr:LysM peptidoglycan-binding domain-containing protein [Candidatus Hydrogenedentota bacterium]